MVIIEEVNDLNRVRCPKCGYEMPTSYDGNAECSGVIMRCKGRQCHEVFELRIKKGMQKFK